MLHDDDSLGTHTDMVTATVKHPGQQERQALNDNHPFKYLTTIILSTGKEMGIACYESIQEGDLKKPEEAALMKGPVTCVLKHT